MSLKPPKEHVLDRFLRYAKIDTRSEEDSETYPSTKKQWDLLNLLVNELQQIGLHDAAADEHGYVTATIPSTLSDEETARVPVVLFCSHVDTSPAITGTNVNPVVHPNYQGGDIVLPGDTTQIISPAEYPNLEKRYIGMDIVTSDGTTLLGADDKSGLAEIMTAADQLLQNTDLRHGPIKILFTPDEEIGHGTKYIDVEKLGADYGYTMDGGPLGEIQFETFNAFGAAVYIQGVGVHPGYAKDKLVNAIRVMADIVHELPEDVTPETTEDREGYIFAYDFDGGAEEIKLKLILRDFEMSGIEEKKTVIGKAVEKARQKYPKAHIDLDFKEQYLNMRYPIEADMRIVEYAEEAIRRTGTKPERTLVRGGTDGARLTHMGLLTPNVFAGGEAFHSKIEWVPVQVMEKAVDTIVNLAQVWAEKELG